MTMFQRAFPTTRRRVLQLLGLLGVGGSELARTAEALADSPGQWPEMTYRTLGRTGFRGSRLVFGCGAALMFWGKDELLEAAFDHGVNVFDVGTTDYYRNAEANLAPFAKKHRDDIFLISKGLVDLEIASGDSLTRAQHTTAARNWSAALDQSLKDLATDHVDAYYVMAVNNTSLMRSEEMHEAFLAAKQAGKVDHWGVSTHENAQAVLAAAVDTGWYSLAQIAITPAGWYDWGNKGVLAGTQSMTALRPDLDQARAAGIGLIGMKAARHLAGRWLGFGPDRPKAFDSHYGNQLLKAPLSPFQRSYAYVLAHGLDAVNADSQSPEHLHENFIAAATSQNYFA
ncbi:aldo/keto reductase [Myxococcota bacterium]|nr:aldo/keto reductase [Myxococcota bacterium]